jgi:GT2 family glycosyltransferase
MDPMPPPMRVVEIELANEVPQVDLGAAADGRQYAGALVLVRLHNTPLGILRVASTDRSISPQHMARSIWSELEGAIRAHLREDGLDDVSDLPVSGLGGDEEYLSCRAQQRHVLETGPLVSVILATHERPDLLRSALDALGKLDYPRYEILVIDNAPRTETTMRLVEAYPGVRYVREDRQGLSWARNRGVAEANGEIVAFTDDDIVVDRHWLTELVRGFDLAEKVGAVTGLRLPLELETPSQAWFEAYGGFGRGTALRVYDLCDHRPDVATYPYSVGMIGPIIAFRTAVLRRLGGFDPALGAGTPSMGGEDLLILYETLAAGYRIVYNPAALEYHRHRREYDVLHRQMYAYGAGLTAYVTSLLLHHPDVFLKVLLKVPAGIRQLFRSKGRGPSSTPAPYPRPLRNGEIRGMLAGPMRYLRSRRIARRLVT